MHCPVSETTSGIYYKMHVISCKNLCLSGVLYKSFDRSENFNFSLCFFLQRTVEIVRDMLNKVAMSDEEDEEEVAEEEVGEEEEGDGEEEEEYSEEEDEEEEEDDEDSENEVRSY